MSERQLMPLIDGRGLLLGKLNLIDAVVGLLVILLIPVGYGAYVVFRIPPPTITAVEPATVPEGIGRVRVLGENLRPFLRAMIGTERGTFLLESPSAGVVELPALPPGTYDLALYDVAQEVARRPSALAIVPVALPPPPTITAIEPAEVPEGTRQVRVRGENLRPFLRATVGTERGTFLLENLSAGVVELPALPPGTYDLALYDDAAQEVARRLSALTIAPPPPPAVLPPPDSEVIVTGAFYQFDEAAAHVVTEKLRASQGKPAAWGSVLGFEPPESIGAGNYRVTAVLKLRCAMVGRTCSFVGKAIVPDQQVAIPLADVPFVVGRAFPSQMTPVDILVRVVSRPEIVALLKRTRGEFTTFPAPAALGPSLLSIDAVEEIAPDGTLAERQTGPLTIALVRVRIPAVEGSTGWRQLSDNQPLKVGAPYRFETSDYVVQGQILDLSVGSHPILLK